MQFNKILNFKNLLTLHNNTQKSINCYNLISQLKSINCCLRQTFASLIRNFNVVLSFTINFIIDTNNY